MVASATLVVAACLVGFGTLGKFYACNPKRPVFISTSIVTDLVYGAVGMLYVGLVPFCVVLVGNAISSGTHRRFAGAIPELGRSPLLAQVALLLVATDFCQYWLHRAFHTSRLWKFHAIHHSAPDVNWTTAFRVHPINQLAATVLLAIGARLMGFASEAFVLAAPILFFSAAVSHANLNWTFGPLRYAIASPIFHRWHHETGMVSRNANFAPIFPIWDIMFGTFRLQKGILPMSYGAENAPRDFLGQLLYPFGLLTAGTDQNARRIERNE
jgi:sterol desaturase/sphingolipid hydroxylase (fatty acid hydroxylase superfamily)